MVRRSYVEDDTHTGKVKKVAEFRKARKSMREVSWCGEVVK
jgi:hypothetical protein